MMDFLTLDVQTAANDVMVNINYEYIKHVKLECLSADHACMKPHFRRKRHTRQQCTNTFTTAKEFITSSRESFVSPHTHKHKQTWQGVHWLC